MRKTIAILIGIAMLPIPLVHAQAPTYPDKPIRIVVPFPVGGIADYKGLRSTAELRARMKKPARGELRSGLDDDGFSVFGTNGSAARGR